MNKKRIIKIMKIMNILIIAFLVIMCLQNILYAANTQIINEIDTASETEQDMDGVFSGVGGFVDGLVGILTFVFRVPILLLAMAIQGILWAIAQLGGHSEVEGMLTPDDLFYNRVPLTNINFFDFTAGGAINTIRTNVATWYYILRIFAIIILLVVLIYIGIRMAVSTVASEQAQYKRMLLDWAVSFALVFLLGYIILFTLEANNAFLEMLQTTVNNRIGNGVTSELIKTTIVGGATSSWAAVICYMMLVGITAAFLFSYIKRMLTIGFLIIISPLITITYSIDRVKDGKAQALNIWLKEFMLTVLIQPFHCIIYTVFVSASLDLMKTRASIGTMVLSIMCMAFIWQAEKIVKKIFGFDAAKTSLGDTVASAVVVKEIGGAITNAAKGTGKALGKTSFGKNINTRINNNPAVSNIRNSIQSHPKLNQAIEAAGKLERSVMKHGMAASMGIASASFEKGLNSSVNAAQLGFQTYNTTKTALDSMENREGSRKNIQLSQGELERCADLVARTNPGFQDYRTNNTSRDNLKQACEGMIGQNLQAFENDIQRMLQRLMTSQPTEYNLTTAAGIANLKKIQDAALNPNINFADGRTNPNYDAVTHPNWTTEEQDVVTAIQMRNLAQAVNSASDNYQAAGYNATEEVKNFIDTLT